MREYCRQGQAEVVSNSSNKIHQTLGPLLAKRCKSLSWMNTPKTHLGLGNNWSCKSLSFKLMKQEGRGVVGSSYASIGETPAAPRFVKWGVSSHEKKEGTGAVHKRYEIRMVYGDVHP